jgi:hypothetical protein
METYLWKAIITKIRSQGKIILAVASCGIATLLLEGGRTAHSIFRIPLTNTYESTCEIKQGSQLAELIKITLLILWDEAPMAHRNCFEALDKSLRDILRFTNEDSSNKPFGGMNVVLGGNFQQILPFVPKGRREHIVNASIKCYYLWKHFEVFKLTQNMCLSCMTDNQNEQQKMKEFAEWILNIGDGKTTANDGDELIQVLDDLLLQKGDDAKDTIVQSAYPDLISNYRERAILWPTNDTTEQINEYIMNKLQGEGATYLSSDFVSVHQQMDWTTCILWNF